MPLSIVTRPGAVTVNRPLQEMYMWVLVNKAGTCGDLLLRGRFRGRDVLTNFFR